MAGADPLDATSRDEPVADCVGPARAGRLKGVRVGVDPNYSLSGLDAPTTAALNAAIAAMKALGAIVVDVKVPEVDSILPRAVMAAAAEAAISHARTYPSECAKYGKAYCDLLDLGLATTAVDYAAVAIWRRELRGALMRMFAAVDMIVVPVLPIGPLGVAEMKAMEAAPPVASAGFMRFTIPFNLAGVPSLTLPMGRTAEVAPLGFQLIGPELSEAALLSAGAAYEAASGFSARHPDI